MPEEKPRFATIVGRSLRLRCPACGEGRLFTGWFSMPSHCSGCGLKYDRAPGYFLGSIYFNYGVTALLIVVLYFAVFITHRVSPGTLPSVLSPEGSNLLWILGAISVLFPAWFFRYARSLWLGMDTFFDPVATEKETAPESESLANEPSQDSE